MPPEINPHDHSYVLGQISSDLQAIKIRLQVIEKHESRLASSEKAAAVTTAELKTISKELENIKSALDKPQVPWTMKAAGFAAVGSIAMSIITLLNVLNP